MLPSSGTITSAQIIDEVSGIVSPSFSISNAPIMEKMVNKSKPWVFPNDLYSKGIKYSFSSKTTGVSGTTTTISMNGVDMTQGTIPSLSVTTSATFVVRAVYNSATGIYKIYIDHGYCEVGINWTISDVNNYYPVSLSQLGYYTGTNTNYQHTSATQASTAPSALNTPALYQLMSTNGYVTFIIYRT